jgi:hypothetical protein
LTAEQVAQVFRDIESKRRVAQYLHAPPVLMEDNPSEVPPEPFVTPAPGPATRTPEPVIQ